MIRFRANHWIQLLVAFDLVLVKKKPVFAAW